MRRLAANISGFKANAIYDCHINTIRDRVSPLDGAPSIVLCHTEFGFLRGMPADRRGIKKNGSALQGRQARAFGIPLIPADESTKASGAGVEGAETEVSRGEVELFVVERVVRDVHLAVEAAQRTVAVEDRGGVVIDAGGALFEERRNQHHAVVTSRGRKSLGRGAWNRFG